MPRFPRSVCLFLPACCLGWLGEALRLTGHTADPEHPMRVALVLRGEAFRGGRSARHLIAKPEWTRTQRDNYDSQLANVVIPFEVSGYEVDVFTAMYSTPYDEILNETFGSRMKLFEPLRFASSNQATNAAYNIEAFERYVNATGREYRFVVFARHDTRFLADVGTRLLGDPNADEHVFLYTKRVPQTAWLGGPLDRCKNTRAWNVADRESITWYCSDRFQVIPQKFVRAFGRFLNGTTLLGNNDRPGHREPRWPGECWAELGPLVGGEEHIDFFEEKVLTLCKTSKAHSLMRIAELRSIPPGGPEMHGVLHSWGDLEPPEDDLPFEDTCEEGVR